MRLLPPAAAFLVTLAATPLLRGLAGRFGLLDRPNERSSHRVVTPRSGGLAILVGLAAALVASGGDWLSNTALPAVVGGALLLVVVGVLDDRYGLPPWPRLACHVAAAVLVVHATGPLERLPCPAPLDRPLGAAGFAVAVLWIVAVVNFYNFMDGIDGLAGVQGVITAAALAFCLARTAAPAAGLAAALAAACAAFLLFNWAPASVFLGDAGSGLIGYTLASLPLLAPPGERSQAVALAGACLFVFLADATTCLLRRVLRGERFYEAHRQHLYQRWVRAGAGHAAVTAGLGVAMLVTTSIAVLGWRSGQGLLGWAALATGALALAAESAHVRRLEARGRAEAGWPSPRR